MSWSIVLDLVLLVLLIGAAVSGWRTGLLRSVFSVVGMIVGGIVAYFAMPWVMTLVPDQGWRVTAAIVSALALVAVGAVIGRIVGAMLSRGAHSLNLGFADRLFGLAGRVIGLALVMSLLLSGISTLGVPVLSPTTADSQVLKTINSITPEPIQALLSDVRANALSSAVPWVTSVLGGPSIAPQIPSAVSNTVELAQATNSVIRVTGTAFACGSNLSGSGFVVGPGRVLTAAHVVAGVAEPLVAGRNGVLVPGKVVAVDAANDLALVVAEGITVPPLRLRETVPAPTEVLAIVGFPSGGPLAIRPALAVSIGSLLVEIDGREAPRDVLTLAADVEQGNSGGPVLTSDGSVSGLVFAKSSNVDHVGYAVPSTVIRNFVSSSLSATQSVKTSCSTK